MLKIYFTTLIVTGVLTLIFGADDIAAIFSILTFGLGFVVIVFVVNTFALLLVSLPGVLLGNRFRALGLLVVLGSVTAYITVPPLLAHQSGARVMTLLAAEEVPATPLADTPNSVTLVFDSVELTDPCPALCKALLDAGIDRVQVIAQDKGGLVFGLVEDPRCDQMFPCVAAVPDLTGPADVRVAVLDVDRSDIAEAAASPFIELSNLRRTTVTQPSAVDERVHFATTSYRLRMFRLPTAFFPEFKHGLNTSGYEMRSTTSSNRAVSHEEALALVGAVPDGLRGDYRSQPDAHWYLLMRSASQQIIARDGTVPVPHVALIDQYIYRQRYQTAFDAEDVGLYRALASEERFDLTQRSALHLQTLIDRISDAAEIDG